MNGALIRITIYSQKMLCPDVISKVHLEKWEMQVYVAGSDSQSWVQLHDKPAPTKFSMELLETTHWRICVTY